MDLISVIIPAYNASKTIEKCLRSICLNETKGQFQFEVIVVNDGSKDNTSNLVKSLAKEFSNISLIEQMNGGPSVARKHGIDVSKGTYLTFCDADDWVETNWLYAMYSQIFVTGADISIIRAIIGDEVKRDFEYKEYSWNKLEAIECYLEHKKINGSFVVKMFNRALFDTVSFEPLMTHCEDDFVFWQMLQKVEKVVRAEVPTYHISVHEGSLTNSKFKMQRWTSTKKYFDRVISDCTNQPNLQPFMHKAESYRVWWYFALMKMMIRDSFYNKAVITELQAVYRNSELSSISVFSKLQDKLLFVLSYISVPLVFKFFTKIFMR